MGPTRIGLRKWLTLLLALLCVSHFSSTYAAESAEHDSERPIIFGITPFMSPIALMQRFTALRNHLSHTLKRQVLIETASSFDEFIKRTAQRRYDLVFTSPTFSLLAVDSGYYRMAATPINAVSAQVVVSYPAPYRTIEDLAELRVATPPAQGFISLAGKELFTQNGVTGNKSPTYIPFRTHNAAYQAVLGGEADAAIISNYVLKKVHHSGIPLRVIEFSRQFPGMGVLVANSNDDRTNRLFVETMISLQRSQNGQQILQKIAFPGFRTASIEEFEPARAFMPNLKKGLH
ncbi:PhnD/SsuA/transferrin family substrate-binding protein [Candidatus Reidiella endopervernicosa]|uniref:PhnD/SsuA/transferrin family substrate-binding protein n=1 Tax=Candidatus Reidiella endopervernicosa TaxID=2738883 RepID=A0A6N0HRC1_9GAMM|nr:PhnD/SsuA/transferrin family substrate-binding protein [Solemya pervernicosa gill symbiont]QKQ24905.1 PhnD/SsuA/transferrin family substrate-binding protein [Candidatus Reidiella endopervernicosa]